MKKTTLNKLVKLALYEVYKENNKTTPKGLKLERITHSERVEFRDSIERKKAKKKRILKEQKNLRNAEEVYNFLVKNSEARVPLEKIAKDPILTKINIDGLDAIYGQISTLTLEEFLELVPDLTVLGGAPPTSVCSCVVNGENNCPNYGTFQVFENACNGGNGPYTIDDRFVCCSSNNDYEDDMQLPLQIDQGQSVDITAASTCFGAFLDQGGSFGGPNPYNPQFANGSSISYDDLNNFLIYAINDSTGLLGANNWQPSYYNGTTSGTNPQPNGISCLACSHPLSSNYDSGALGCDGDPNSSNYECCDFYGCGASGNADTFPPPNPNSLTTINATGNFPDIFGDESQSWFTDDGSCTFDAQCTQPNVEITVPAGHPDAANNPIIFNTTTPFATTVVTSAGVYPSSYDGVTLVDDGSCEIEVCANPALDPYGVNLNQLGSNVTGNTFVALEYNQQTAGGYSITNDNNKCFITACTDDGAYNYINFEAEGIPLNNITSDPLLCVDVAEGCMDPDAFNFDSTANVDDGSCIAIALGCTDGAALNYDPLANTDDGSCIAIVQGCTDDTAFNYNAAANVDDGSCIPELVGCMDGGSGNQIVQVYGFTNQANNFNSSANVECTADNSTCLTYNLFDLGGPTQTIGDNANGCCCQYSPGCTIFGSANYNPQANHDDGSCEVGIPGCMSPGMDNYDPTANIDDDSCVYEGCVDAGDYLVGATPSPWLDYVCLNPDSVTGQTLTVGELLCDCGAGQCNANSTFNNTYGAYIDGSTYSQLQGNPNATTNNYTDPFTGGTQNNGSCLLLTEEDGCTIEFYTQNDGDGNIDSNVTPGGYVSGINIVDDGSCEFFACDDPGALNYFCVDNPTLCDMTQNNGAGAVLPALASTLFQPMSYECVYPESFDCDYNLGCQNPGDGNGQYNSLAACEEACQTISYNCEDAGCVEDNTGQIPPGGEYTIYNAETAGFTINYPPYDVGDPFEYCESECTAVSYRCDMDFGCYNDGTGNIGDVGGIMYYNTLGECAKMCVSYNCDEDLGCVDPENGEGQFIGDGSGNTSQTILEMCEAECVECSVVDTQKCLSQTGQKELRCLEIDGERGNSGITGTSSPLTSAYGIGQFFEYDTMVNTADNVSEQIINTVKETREVISITNIFSTDSVISMDSDTCFEGFNCNTAHQTPPVNVGSCIGTGAQTGNFTGENAEQDCINSCFPLSWDCRGDVCATSVDSDGNNDGMGQFSNISAAAAQNTTDPNNWTTGFFDANGNPDPEAECNAEGNCPAGDWCGTCFIGDTLITMPDNTTKRIDELKVDEIVKSEKETSQIIKIDVHEGEFDLYSINGSKHFVTEDHPFQTTEGWKAITPAKATIKHEIVIIEEFILKVGDTLIKENGETEEIITLEKSEEKISTTTYNLRLDNEHVYYADGYLVHNGGVRRKIKENIAGAGSDDIFPWDWPVDNKPSWCPPKPNLGGPIPHKCVQANNPNSSPSAPGCGNNLTCCIPTTTPTPSNATTSGTYPSLISCQNQCQWNPDPVTPVTPPEDTDSKEDQDGITNPDREETTDIKESKILRKLIKQWRKNNL